MYRFVVTFTRGSCCGWREKFPVLLKFVILLNEKLCGYTKKYLKQTNKTPEMFERLVVSWDFPVINIFAIVMKWMFWWHMSLCIARQRFGVAQQTQLICSSQRCAYSVSIFWRGFSFLKDQNTERSCRLKVMILCKIVEWCLLTVALFFLFFRAYVEQLHHSLTRTSSVLLIVLVDSDCWNLWLHKTKYKSYIIIYSWLSWFSH